MKKIRYAIVGSGYRALFYVRLATILRSEFELCGMLCRTSEKADKIKSQYNINAFVNEQDMLDMNPDFVVVAVSKSSIYEVSLKYALQGIPVLCETPASLVRDEIVNLYRLSKEGTIKLQVAEQYLQYPMYNALSKALKTGIIGDPYAIDISAMHDYHAFSIIREYLNTGYENVKVTAKKYVYPVTITETRAGKVYDGKIEDRDRVRAELEFDNGKTAFYDFNSVQYRSSIREKSIKIQGVKGEFVNTRFNFLDDEYQPNSIECRYDEYGHIVLGDNILYKDMYCGLKLSDDEKAIAHILKGMKEYIDTGAELYSLKDALWDDYLTTLMNESLECGKSIISEDIFNV